jgi:transposase
MEAVNLAREKNIDVVRMAAQLALRENDRLVELTVRLRKENLHLRGLNPAQLQQELALLDKQLEREANKLNEDFEKAKAAEQDKSKPVKKPRARSGPREQPKLEVIEVAHPLDDADKVCASCGLELAHWEGQDDETEEVDVITRRFVIKKHIRPKYRCKCGCIEQADMPPRLVPGGRYSNAFAVEVAAMKYVDQLPLERIARIFKGEGVDVDSQTLWDQVNALASKLQPAWERLRDEALKARVVGFDQSPWKVLGHEKVWQAWELSTSKIAYFDICQSKGAEDGARVIGDYAGVLIGDAATTHTCLAKSGRFTLAHCWAHPRRDAEKLLASDPQRAEAFIRFVRELYDVEEQAGDDIERRRARRDTTSRDVIQRLRAWRLEQRVLPSSPTAKLLGYIDNHWTGLTRFLDNPLIPLDNNQTERGYLWVAVGRRSFFGSRSKRGTEVAAIFYSLAESARRCGIDPKQYLAAALAEALDGSRITLPHELLANR